MRYMAALDGLRGVAVALVVAYHAACIPAGYLGVDVFFVLSGFLITGLLLTEQRETARIDIVNFYTRRALRLFPCLWLVVGAVLLYAWLLHSPQAFSHDRLEAAFALLYLENWRLIWDASAGNMLQHTWSLAIEEQFYLVWAVVAAIWLPRLTPRRTAAIFAALLALASLWRVIVWEIDGRWLRIFAGSDTRADELIAGALLAILYSVDPIKKKLESARTTLGALAVLCLIGLVLLGCFATAEQEGKLFGVQPLATLATVMVIADLVGNPTGLLSRCLSQRWLVYLGSISYGIYLWHDPLNWIAVEWGAGFATRVLVIAGGGIALAAASYRYVESPALALKNELRRRRARHPSGAQPLLEREALH